MKHRNSYYTLVASLPPLPRFDGARRLPINRVRLLDRLSMLEPADAEVVKHAAAFFAWDRPGTVPTDGEMIKHHQALVRLGGKSSFREVLEFPFDLKTLLAGLRRRRMGRPAPVPGESWGVGRWVGHIERNWDEPDFKLAPQYPWLPEMRNLLEKGEALALQKQMFGLVWDHLDRLTQGMEFRFDNVLAYLFKWDILERWLSQKPDEARACFEERITEALHEP